MTDPGNGRGAPERPTQHPRGPEEHKSAAQALGLPNVRELLVLAPNNDPFYKGTPAQRRDAEWFADMWERFGYTTGVHLRRVHYQVLSTGSVTSNGTPYVNTETCWTGLCAAAAAARLLGLVDAEAFVDRRNPDPVINRYPRTEPAEPSWSWGDESWLPDWALPEVEPAALAGIYEWLLPFVPRWELPSVDLLEPEWSGLQPPPRWVEAQIDGYDYTPDDQPVLLEVWVEKSTMQDILDPLCRALNINLVTGVGNQSITAAIRLLRRAERHGKPAHVLYVSDFDPAGEHMPVAVARQAQFWRDQLKVDVPLTLDPLVLTREQIDRYSLPRVPIKEEDRRKANFEARNGSGAVELDALEALHPGVFGTIVRQAAAPYIDRSLPTVLADARHEAQEAVSDQWRDDTAELRGALARVECDVRSVIARYEEQVRGVRGELVAELAPERRQLDEIAVEMRSVLANLIEPFRPRLDAVARSANVKVEHHRQTLSAATSELSAALAQHQQRVEHLTGTAERIVDEFEPDLPDRPEPIEPDTNRDALLYDSGRHWFEQLTAYRRVKGRAA